MGLPFARTGDYARTEDLFVQRPWSGVHATRAHLIDNADIEIVAYANLAREAHVRSEFRLDREAIAFEFAHRPGIAFKHFDAARRATRISAAAVKNIDTGVF